MTSAERAERLARLSPGQIDALRLVAQQYTSKEIALRLGVSPHTVDQRIRAALGILQVERRAEAARIVAQSTLGEAAGAMADAPRDAAHEPVVAATIATADAPQSPATFAAPRDCAGSIDHGPSSWMLGSVLRSQPLIYQSPHLPRSVADGQSGPATGFQIRHVGCAEGRGQAGVITEQAPFSPTPLVWPIATRANPRNRMGIAARLMWILSIALGASLAAGMFLAGLESLARMLGS